MTIRCLPNVWQIWFPVCPFDFEILKQIIQVQVEVSVRAAETVLVGSVIPFKFSMCNNDATKVIILQVYEIIRTIGSVTSQWSVFLSVGRLISQSVIIPKRAEKLRCSHSYRGNCLIMTNSVLGSTIFLHQLNQRCQLRTNSKNYWGELLVTYITRANSSIHKLLL